VKKFLDIILRELRVWVGLRGLSLVLGRDWGWKKYRQEDLLLDW
jgi:hypothetical protein